MSQDAVYAVLTTEPQTQNQIDAKLHLGTGTLSHRLNSLAKKGMIQIVRLETRYRPNGYVRVS